MQFLVDEALPLDMLGKSGTASKKPLIANISHEVYRHLLQKGIIKL